MNISRPLTALALGLGLIALPGALSAQTPGFGPNGSSCNVILTSDMVNGDYDISTGPLLMTIGPMQRIMEPAQSGKGTIYSGPLRDFMLKMKPPIPDFKLEVTDRLQPDWYWDSLMHNKAGQGLPLASADTALVMGCDIREMPRFIGKFQTKAQDGTPVNYTIMLVMVSKDWMMGSLRFNANPPQGPVSAVRWIQLSRTKPMP